MTFFQQTNVFQAVGRTDREDNQYTNVLFVSFNAGRNSVATNCLSAIKDCLTGNGWRVGQCSSDVAVKTEYARCSSEVRAPSAPARSLRFMRNLVRTIPRYDVVHLFFLSGMSFTWDVVPALILGRFWGKRVVLSYHRNQAEAELERSGWWMLPFFRLCNGIVVSSEYTASLLALYGLATELIAPAVNKDLFKQRMIDSIQPRIIIARSLEKRNNIPCAIEAFSLVKQKYPRAEMVIAGDGSQRDELEGLTLTKKLNGVTFTGWVSPRDLSRYFAEADVYVNVSSIDGLPLSLLEALAVGLPIVTTGAGGIPDVINDGINGFIVRPNDPAGLADRIIELVESPELVQQLSEQAKLSARDHSLVHVKEKWSDIYNNLNGYNNQDD